MCDFILTPSLFGLKKCSMMTRTRERRSRRGRQDRPHTHALEMLANFAIIRTMFGSQYGQVLLLYNLDKNQDHEILWMCEGLYCSDQRNLFTLRAADASLLRTFCKPYVYSSSWLYLAILCPRSYQLISEQAKTI